MSSNEANRDAAEQCTARAATAQAAGNRDEAVRLLQKSMRLCETPKARAALQRLLDGGGGGGGSTPSAAADPSPDSPAPGGGSSPGLRHRRPAEGGAPTASPATPATPAAGSAARPRAASDAAARRAYTPEEAAVAKRICTAPNYFAVLGVERDADTATIKKAFKRLAVLVHPDKNAAPRAEEAFKKLAAAVSVLSDPDKRALYNATGNTDGEAAPGNARSMPAGGGGGGGGGGGMRAGHYNYAQAEAGIDPEDIFRAFFGGGGPLGGGVGFGFAPGGVQFRSFGGQRFGHMHPQQQQQYARAGGPRGGGEQPPLRRGPAEVLFQLLPMLFILLFSLLQLSGGGRSESVFSVTPDAASRLTAPMVTIGTRMGVPSELPYYVRPGSTVEQRLASDPMYRAQFERLVAQTAREEFRTRCWDEQRTMRTLQAQRATTGSKARRDQYDARLAEMQQDAGSGCKLYTRYFEGG